MSTSQPARIVLQPHGPWQLQRRLGSAALYAILLVFALFMLLPFAFALTGSLKPELEIFAIPMRWIPSTFQWQNYLLPFQQANFGRYFLNSAIVALAQTLGPLLLCSLGGVQPGEVRLSGADADLPIHPQHHHVAAASDDRAAVPDHQGTRVGQ